VRAIVGKRARRKALAKALSRWEAAIVDGDRCACSRSVL